MECGNIGLKAFILAYDNISRAMINNSSMAMNSQVEMMLGTLPIDLGANVVMKLELDHRDRSIFRYNEL